MRDYVNTAVMESDGIYKEVVVIGNGPSGLALSYMLAGNWPYYNGNTHLDEMLTARLKNSPSGRSLVQQDLKFLSEGLEGRSNHPISLLMDSLNHPSADQGLDLPSLLNWRSNPERLVDHVVLGKGPPGGAWHTMDGNVLTISLNTWMELPGLEFRKWESHHNCNSSGAPRRVPVATVAAYYKDYVKQMGLSRFMRFGVVVTSVSLLDCRQNQANTCIEDQTELGSCHCQPLWSVEGFDTTTGLPFTYICKKVILASGSTDLHNRLNVSGEMRHPNWIFHNLKTLEDELNILVEKNKDSRDGVCQVDPVLIVGAGLSAADGIISARFHSVPVIHVFRRPAGSSEKTLPENMYPEYHKVHQMMGDKGLGYSDYRAFPEHKICEFSAKPDKKVKIMSSSGVQTCHQVSLVAVLIGSRPDLSFMSPEFEDGKKLGVYPERHIDCRSNPMAIDPYTYCLTQGPPGLYALGPLAGDNFVRFLIGGALAITAHIYWEKKAQRTPAHR
uniref:FAD/NAD(P)-binding domain-containing protein n=1 Tax=Clastoptera arizonana TaxID=38151 RepID=A0A1B6D3R4_9HEMI